MRAPARLNPRLLLPLLLLVALLGLLGRGLGRDPRALPSALVGREAPAFELPRLEAQLPPLSSRVLAGKPWVLNVWASWCGPCREELPQLKQLAGHGVALVGLNYKDESDAAQRWITEAGVSPFTASLRDADGRTALDWGVTGVPETFIIDAQGRVVWRHAGPLTAKLMREQFWPRWREVQR